MPSGKAMKIEIKIALTVIIAWAILPQCKSEKPEIPEVRAVWIHPGLFSAAEDTALVQMRELFDSYRKAGINNLFCYNAMADENDFRWDYLRALISEGHKRNIKIHPIICPGYPVHVEGELAEHPEWLVVNIDGTSGSNLNPALPEVRSYWLRRVAEAAKYEIDGIHLDYARFAADQKYSYDSITCNDFKRVYGSSPADVAHDCGSIIWCEWIKWNTACMTDLIRAVSNLIRTSGKDLVLGLDVFPDYETAQVLIGQDWDEWASEGIVDFICPMLYTNDTALFRRYLKRAREVAGVKCQVWPGIGLRTSHNIITPDLLVREVTIAEEEGAEGVAFFSGFSLNKEMMKLLDERLKK
jgi:uncharacterized lipoprotein YddW (UPF0748 family)